MFKKILIICFSVLSAFLLYQAIGYLVLGAKSPVLYNGVYAHFMGMYIMSITYGVFFLISTIILLLIIFKMKGKKNNKTQENKN